MATKDVSAASSKLRGHQDNDNEDEAAVIHSVVAQQQQQQHRRDLAYTKGGYYPYPYDSSYYGYHYGGGYSYDYYPYTPDIPTTAIENGMFTTLVAALTAADLVGAISAPEGPFTVFAPTDDAFAALPTGLVDCLLNDIPTLTDILLYHVAEGMVTSSMLMNGMLIPTLEGQSVVVSLTKKGGVFINEAEVVLPDVMASNGVIHVIDSVLVPPGIDVTAYLDSCYGYAPGYYHPGGYYPGGYKGYKKPYVYDHYTYSF